MSKPKTNWLTKLCRLLGRFSIKISCTENKDNNGRYDGNHIALSTMLGVTSVMLGVLSLVLHNSNCQVLEISTFCCSCKCRKKGRADTQKNATDENDDSDDDLVVV